MTKIAIVLAGCGVHDGSEIHESVLTLLHVVKKGATPLFFAPDILQLKTVDHISGETESSQRNVLTESARIARGDISPLSEIVVKDLDAIIFPGGFGAALNLCDFAVKSAECSVNTEVDRVIRDFHAAKKPIGFICIAPTIGAKTLGSENIELTIGTDESTAKALETLGATHHCATVSEILVDEKNLVVSTPAYMLAKNIAEAEQGIEKLVAKIVALA